MEDQLVQVLANTQLAAEGPRKQAELDLKQAQTNPAYPLSLVNIASHTSISVEIRQQAISTLRLFTERNWSGESDDGHVIPISDAAKDQIRPILLELALNSERKIKAAASFAVGRIANVDFPERWPALLPTLFGCITSGDESHLHGALKILCDLVDESLSDDQFFSMAQDIVKVVYDVAVGESDRKPILRALAVSVFRGCFDLMDQVKEDHPQEVKAFAELALAGWFPFFLQTMKMSLPQHPDADFDSQPEEWNGIIALKLQVVRCLLKVKSVFPNLLLPQTPLFFEAAWAELLLLSAPYEQLYVTNGIAQGRLEDADGLPYTLDFLVLEELDFLNGCLKAKPVQSLLEERLKAHPTAHETPWVLDVMKLATSYARITSEEEELWDIDVSLYLAEEWSVSANYTPRTACGDLLCKLGEWLKNGVFEGLFAHTKTVFATDSPSWRTQEASLFLLNMLVSDFLDCGKEVPVEIVQAYLELVDYCINRRDEPLLRARGFLVAGMLIRCHGVAAGFLDRVLTAINAPDETEIVQVACIRALEGFVTGGAVQPNGQSQVVQAIGQWITNKDMTTLEEADDLLISLAETLRAAINIDKRVALSNEVPALDLLFQIAKHGANNFQVTMMICETFEDIVQTMADPHLYQLLCQKVLPSLTSTFDAANVTSDDPLVTFAAELMAALTQYGSEPLPPGFVAATLPKLTRLLMESIEGEVLRPGSESVKYLLQHGHHQVFNYQDENGTTGVEICLRIIDRLLKPEIEDQAASEVGGLAAELVEKAGPERLGEYLDPLLKAVATRLATAEAASFIQSLILVFARLSMERADAVVEFLSQLQIPDRHGNGQPGLQVVLAKWLENSVIFAGFDEIRQNVIALSKLYELNDPRLAQTMVRGDLIIPVSDRIMTRSRAKENPDQYTIVPATLKIIKILVEELTSASGAQNASSAAAAAAAKFADEEEEDEDGWEDEPDTVDLNLGSTKNDLMSYLEASSMTRHQDDETNRFLTDFFRRVAQSPDFHTWFEMLTDEEKQKLTAVVS
ncbi:importin-beta domain-containing protein [Apiospora kogelbergensis]|uniref:Importin-beta domain-containing protein n=1 Tax=Apiospora kogelbergensis TaxID=1337665 RepID=A0AAW0QJB1_9PEZI